VVFRRLVGLVDHVDLAVTCLALSDAEFSDGLVQSACSLRQDHLATERVVGQGLLFRSGVDLVVVGNSIVFNTSSRCGLLRAVLDVLRNLGN